MKLPQSARRVYRIRNFVKTFLICNGNLHISFIAMNLPNILYIISLELHLIIRNFLNKFSRACDFQMQTCDIYARNQTKTFFTFLNLPRNLVPRFHTFFVLWPR